MPEDLDGFALKMMLGETCYLTTKHVLNPESTATVVESDEHLSLARRDHLSTTNECLDLF